MLLRKLFLIFILSCTAFFAHAQSKPVRYEQQAWAGWFSQFRFNKHFGLWADVEIHSADHFFNGFSQAGFRLAAIYYNNKSNKFTAGYGFTDFFPGENHAHVSLQEHFGWEQYQWYHTKQRTKLMQWIRAEQKFKNSTIDSHTASDSYSLTHKFRYNIFYQLSLNKKGFVPHGLALAVGNEIYLYHSPGGQNHLFDQDRLFLGFSYAVNRHDNLVFGVTNIFKENSAGTAYTNTSVLRVSLFQNFGF
ncbi:MAG: DUF2490 domain-containing protein [Bacteroidetes bacterium]|nr:DUF2490 domain-containing protein [Bacteroidota bacterium]